MSSVGSGYWSPDGRQIILTALRQVGDDALTGVYIVSAAGGTPRLLTDGDLWAWDGRFSPDGRRIAFAQERRGTSSFDIWVVNADGSGARAITSEGDNALGGWSPDGTQIYFRTVRDGLADLAVAPAEGGATRLLTHTPLTDELGGEMTPDGRHIIYSGGQLDRRIVSVNVEPLLNGSRKPEARRVRRLVLARGLRELGRPSDIVS